MDFFWRGHSPNSDIKNVAAHRAGHSHVPQAFTGHNHAGDQVRDGRSGCQKGQTHDFLWDAHSLTHLEKKYTESVFKLKGTEGNHSHTLFQKQGGCSLNILT